jgi:hypothetical protein
MIIFLFIILQQNSDSTKVENDVDVLNEGGSTDMMSNDVVYTPLLTFSLQKDEPEVRHVFFNVVFVGDVSLHVSVCEKERERSGVIRYNFS